MPAGTTWPRYLTFIATAMFSMFIGAQVVHAIYKPLADLDMLVDKEVEERLKRQHISKMSKNNQNT